MEGMEIEEVAIPGNEIVRLDGAKDVILREDSCPFGPGDEIPLKRAELGVPQVGTERFLEDVALGPPGLPGERLKFCGKVRW